MGGFHNIFCMDNIEGGWGRKYPYSTTVNEIDIHLLKQAKDHLEKSYSPLLKCMII